jgi:hypothetical protein
VLATPFASTDRAYALKVSHHVWSQLRDFLAIEMNLIHPQMFTKELQAAQRKRQAA